MNLDIFSIEIVFSYFGKKNVKSELNCSAMRFS